MKKGYLLLGHDVTKEIYEKYNNEKYPFMGRLVRLDGIYIWATDDEIAKQFPERAAEAKTIIATIEKEITGMNKTQQKITFHSFIDELQTIFREEMAAYNSAQDAFDIAQTEYTATMADSKAPEHIKLIARGEYEKAKLNHKTALKQVLGNYNARVKDLRQKMADFATDVYRATPDRIDQKAMQLLNTGILSPDEMDHLASQFRDNPPMMRIIGSYAKQKAESMSDWDKDSKGKYQLLAHTLNRLTNSEAALDGFDHLAEFGRNGLNRDIHFARAHENNWERMYSTAREAYNDFIIQPGCSKE